MQRVPFGLARYGFEDVRVDLGQRVVSRDAPKRERQARIDAGVVERVARLVEERLVVGETTLRARDQVHDLRRVRRDHTGARILLRPVFGVESDVRDRRHVEPECERRRQGDLDGALLRVRRLERREPA